MARKRTKGRRAARCRRKTPQGGCWCRELLHDPQLRAVLKSTMQDPTHPRFIEAWRFVAEAVER